jgi:1,4-dihydroxy-2-naphthoate octaprenyltransferase
MLVGKRNLVVRLGKQRAILLLKLGLAGVFGLLALGLVLKTIPVSAIIAVTALPWILKSVRSLEKDCDNPKAFLFAVNTIVINHTVIALSLGISFLWD